MLLDYILQSFSNSKSLCSCFAENILISLLSITHDNFVKALQIHIGVKENLLVQSYVFRKKQLIRIIKIHSPIFVSWQVVLPIFLPCFDVKETFLLIAHSKIFNNLYSHLATSFSFSFSANF